MTTCPANTIDSNITGLAVAEEICPGVLPNMSDDGFLPTWYEQEPNTYPSNFGGSLKTEARAPIKANRQRSKGTTVDLDAQGGWNTDYTQNNLTRLSQGFFFANAREKTTTAPLNSAPAVIASATASTKTYAGTDMPRFRAADIVNVKDTNLNGGIKTVSTSSPTALVVNETTFDETLTEDAAIGVVGKAFTAGLVAITLSDHVGTIHLTASPVAATNDYTVGAGNADDGDTVTIGSVEYTWRTAVPTLEGEVRIGADVTASATNLKDTINGLSTLTPAHPDVSATSALGVVTVTARLKGVSENAIATTEAGANTSWDTGTLTGGTGISLLSLGMAPGEWGFLGADATGTHFADNIGYFRMGSCTDIDLVMDRTTWDVTAEAAGALTIYIFNGTLIQNENDPDLIVRRTYQMQRRLGNDGTGTQSQYITGCACDQMTFNVPLAAKLTVDLSFIAQTTEYRTGAQGLKDGSLVPALNEDAINTSNDVYEMAMTVIDATNSNPTKLFGYLSKADVKINNNVSAIKGIGALGGIGVNVGIFQVSGTATAYFTNVGANIAITNNADVDCHFILAKHNAGAVYDIGLLTLGGGNITIAANKPIEIPLTTDAAQNEHGSTFSNTIFNYLPTLAMPEAV